METSLWMGVDGFAALVDVQDTASTFTALRLGTGGYLLLDGFTAPGASNCSGVLRCMFANIGDFGEHRVMAHVCQYR